MDFYLFFQKLIKFFQGFSFMNISKVTITYQMMISIKVLNFNLTVVFFLLIFMVFFFFGNRNLLPKGPCVNYFNQVLFTTCQWFCISVI